MMPYIKSKPSTEMSVEPDWYEMAHDDMWEKSNGNRAVEWVTSKPRMNVEHGLSSTAQMLPSDA